MHWTGCAFRFLALSPVLFLGLVYTEACAAWHVLGHWPVPSVDDPGALPTAPLHLLSGCALLALVPAAILFVQVGAGVFDRINHPRRWLAAFLVAWTVLLLSPLLDPITAEWWLD